MAREKQAYVAVRRRGGGAGVKNKAMAAARYKQQAVAASRGRISGEARSNQKAVAGKRNAKGRHQRAYALRARAACKYRRKLRKRQAALRGVIDCAWRANAIVMVAATGLPSKASAYARSIMYRGGRRNLWRDASRCALK